MTIGVLKLTDVSSLSAAAISEGSVNYDWSEHEWDTDYRIVYPDTDNFTMEMCLEYMSDYGIGGPDPSIEDLDREALISKLDEAGYLDEDYDLESENDEGDRNEEAFNISDPREGKEDKVLSSYNDDELRELVIHAMNEEDCDGIDEYRECVRDHFNESDSFHPMMNYYYPIPGFDRRCDPEAEAVKLMNTCLTLVHFPVDDEYALALTGGGMDLSWEICEAYMMIGYLPPLRFASDLPKMAGKENSPENKWILEGCLRSAEMEFESAQRSIAQIKGMMDWLAEEEQKHLARDAERQKEKDSVS